MTPDQVFTSFETGFSTRRFSAGLLIAFIDFYNELGVPASNLKDFDELLAKFPRQTTTAAGNRAYTLIVSRGNESTLSLRPFYSAAERFFRVDHKRLDYPSCAPHATQAWANYREWLDALATFDGQQLAALRKNVVDHVLTHLKSRTEAHAAPGARARSSIELLHSLDSALDPRLTNHERGARFEEFAVGFFNKTLKVVSRDLRTENGELDLIVEIIRSDPFWIEFGGDALVECKNWTSNVPLSEVGAFLSKVNQGRVKLAFFLSMSGFTEDARRTLRNHAANVTAALVVPLSGASIKKALMSDVILEEFLKEEIRAMKYLRKY